MAAANPNPDVENESPQRIISPFAQTTSTVQAPQARNATFLALWIVSGLLFLVLAGLAAYFTVRYLNDPFRTLEPFPVQKYLDDYRPLAGGKFKADLKVSNDLGYKLNVGHLMVFTVEGDNHALVVLIPPKLSGIYFTKGQNYQVSLEIQEGGMIYADSCEKK